MSAMLYIHTAEPLKMLLWREAEKETQSETEREKKEKNKYKRRERGGEIMKGDRDKQRGFYK